MANYDEIMKQEDKPFWELPSIKNELENVLNALRQLYPHGHEEFIPLMLKHIKLHSDKNFDYAHGGDPMGNFCRVAIILKQYPGLDPGDPAVVAIIYLLKQLDAALWLKAKGHEAKIQGAGERWDDVSVYSNIIHLIEEEKK